MCTDGVWTIAHVHRWYLDKSARWILDVHSWHLVNDARAEMALGQLCTCSAGTSTVIRLATNVHSWSRAKLLSAKLTPFPFGFVGVVVVVADTAVAAATGSATAVLTGGPGCFHDTGRGGAAPFATGRTTLTGLVQGTSSIMRGLAVDAGDSILHGSDRYGVFVGWVGCRTAAFLGGSSLKWCRGPTSRNFKNPSASSSAWSFWTSSS